MDLSARCASQVGDVLIFQLSEGTARSAAAGVHRRGAAKAQRTEHEQKLRQPHPKNSAKTSRGSERGLRNDSSADHATANERAFMKGPGDPDSKPSCQTFVLMVDLGAHALV